MQKRFYRQNYEFMCQISIAVSKLKYDRKKKKLCQLITELKRVQ